MKERALPSYPACQPSGAELDGFFNLRRVRLAGNRFRSWREVADSGLPETELPFCQQ